jgi:hypothetical protein
LRHRRRVVAEQRVVPANPVERASLSAAVAGGPVQLARLPGMLKCPLRVTVPDLQAGQAVVGVRLAGPVADPRVQVGGLPAVHVGFGVPSEPDVGPAEEAVRQRLGGEVPEPLGGEQRHLPSGGLIVPVALTGMERVERPGQLPGMGVEPRIRGLPENGITPAVMPCWASRAARPIIRSTPRSAAQPLVQPPPVHRPAGDGRGQVGAHTLQLGRQRLHEVLLAKLRAADASR